MAQVRSVLVSTPLLFVANARPLLPTVQLFFCSIDSSVDWIGNTAGIGLHSVQGVSQGPIRKHLWRVMLVVRMRPNRGMV